MAETQPNQAVGGSKSHSDGVEDPVGKGPGGGESGGGSRATPPKSADEGGEGGFMGHGGQSHIAYSGTGDDDGAGNANAATGTE